MKFRRELSHPEIAAFLEDTAARDEFICVHVDPRKRADEWLKLERNWLGKWFVRWDNEARELAYCVYTPKGKIHEKRSRQFIFELVD